MLPILSALIYLLLCGEQQHQGQECRGSVPTAVRGATASGTRVPGGVYLLLCREQQHRGQECRGECEQTYCCAGSNSIGDKSAGGSVNKPTAVQGATASGTRVPGECEQTYCCAGSNSIGDKSAGGSVNKPTAVQGATASGTRVPGECTYCCAGSNSIGDKSAGGSVNKPTAVQGATASGTRVPGECEQTYCCAGHNHKQECESEHKQKQRTCHRGRAGLLMLPHKPWIQCIALLSQR